MGLYLMAFISTVYVLKQCNKNKVAISKQKFEMEQDDKSSNKWSEIEQILSTKNGFNAFGHHLMNEFCIQNLFFLDDMMQIKNKVLSAKVCNAEDIGVLADIDIRSLYIKPENEEERDQGEPNFFDIGVLKADLRYIMKKYICKDCIYSLDINKWFKKRLIARYEV